MADGRKNNGGHSTKPKRDNDKRLATKSEAVQLYDSMTTVLPNDELVEIFAEHVRNGDIQALKLWLEYLVGKPRQSVDVTSDGDKLPALTVQIVRPDES